MADAERLVAALKPRQGVAYTGIFLNDAGLRRALDCADKLTLVPELILSASAAFARRNQNRSPIEDVESQRWMARTFQDHGLQVRTGNIMAAFGCNYEGAIPLQRVLDLIKTLADLAAETGGTLTTINLADTMGWANPEQIKRTVAALRETWPGLRIGLHLHDTRGLAIANVYAAFGEGVDRFDAAVGGLGGCPFAGHRAASGNVASEEVVFLCQELGIATGIDLDRLIEAAQLAEEVVGHPLPSRLIRSSIRPLEASTTSGPNT